MGEPHPPRAADNRFCLYSQPVYATHGDDGVPAYTELLLRLRDDDGSSCHRRRSFRPPSAIT
jgi:hypothetical protein